MVNNMPCIDPWHDVEETEWHSWIIPVTMAFLLHVALLWFMQGQSSDPTFSAAQVMRVSIVKMASPKPSSIPVAQPETSQEKPHPQPKAIQPKPSTAPAAHAPAMVAAKASPNNEHDSSDIILADDSAAAESPANSEPDYKAAYLNNPVPRYPNAARRRGWQGRVVLNVEVLAAGVCGHINISQSSGHDMLDRAALEAVKQWRFVPAYHAGMAVTRWFQVPIRFELQAENRD